MHEVFETIDEVYRARTGRTVSAVVFAAGAPRWRRFSPVNPDELQLAIYGASVTTHRMLATQGAIVDLLVGHSFGEIAALVASGAYSVADGASLDCERNEAQAALRRYVGRSAVPVFLAALPDQAGSLSVTVQIKTSGPGS